MIDWSIILTTVGVLVLITNIITQVLKQLTGKLPTNILAVIVSLVVTMLTLFAYCQINAITVAWYMVAAALVLGFFVAYAAMFGYDKLCEVINRSA